jgi:hypothetical protein
VVITLPDTTPPTITAFSIPVTATTLTVPISSLTLQTMSGSQATW